jgi:hypothetical protein
LSSEEYTQAYLTIVEELIKKYLKGHITILEYNIALKISAKVV